MWNCIWAASAVLVLAATPARAQTVTPVAGSKVAAAASAAMERAKRQAAGPMRVILEASRPRRKAADADLPVPAPPTPTPPSDSGSVRAVASRSPTVATVAPAPITRSVAALPGVAPIVLTIDAPSTAPSTALYAAPTTAQAASAVTQNILTSETLQTMAPAAWAPGLETTGSLIGTEPPAATATALASLPKLPGVPTTAAGPASVKLINRVDPELPQRQLDDMGRNAVVTVDLTIRTDGSVGNVAMVRPTPRGIQRAVLAALEQWRFDPLPSERVHRVQLIFNPEP